MNENKVYKLNWLNFGSTYDYAFNLSGIRLAFKAPETNDYLLGFDISVESLEKQIALAENTHGPVELAYCSWSCECEDDKSVYIQGSISSYIKIFHSFEFSDEKNKLIKNDKELKKAIIKLSRISTNLNGDHSVLVKSDTDIKCHTINGRMWYETTYGFVPGTWYYIVYTRLSDEITLAVFFNMAGFWSNEKLPDPAHKDIVFESALDFLKHFTIVMPEDIHNHPDLPPLGKHSPHREEKELTNWGEVPGASASSEDASDDTW